MNPDAVLTRRSKRSKTSPTWAFFSLAFNACLGIALILLLLQSYVLSPGFRVSASAVQSSSLSAVAPQSQLGRRYQLNYEQWVTLLAQEARVAAEKHPKNLTVLAGDSLSLWFPTYLLPSDRAWLNQGISGETSAGLLKRLSLFDQTNPQTIFVLIGINDLVQGASEETILENYRQIVQYLQQAHPKTQVVMQSILPHAGGNASWQGREILRKLPNDRIRSINQRLAAIAAEHDVYYLDLHALFMDERGNLRSELSTDGLHLSSQGYLVWRSALQLFSQLKLQKK